MTKKFFLIVALLIVFISFGKRPEEYKNTTVRYFDQETLERHQGKAVPEKKEAKDTEGDASSDFSFDIGNIGKGLLILVIVAGIGALAYYLGGGTFEYKRSYANASSEGMAEGLHSNIHEIDFETTLKAAIEEGNYKEASRLLFLHALKMMSDQKIIDWQINKTNRDYYYEIKKKALKQQFKEVSVLFEYMVYGDFELSEMQFFQMQEVYKNFNKMIK